jgi:hypothetical protein
MSLPAGGSLVVGDDSLFASAGLALSQPATSPSSAANAAPATTTNVEASIAIVPPASLTTAKALPVISLDGQQQLRRTTGVGNNVPSLRSPAAIVGNPVSIRADVWPPKSGETWLPAIAQFWNEQRPRQSNSSAKARAVDIVMMTRNASV